MICENCSKTLEGKQQRFCSDKCRMKVKRAETAAQDHAQGPNPNQPEQIHQGITVKDGHATGKLSAAFDQALKNLPPAPTRPTVRPSPATGKLNSQQLKQRVSSYHGQAWISSPEYAETIYRLLTLSIDELNAAGQIVPAWRAIQEAA